MPIENGGDKQVRKRLFSATSLGSWAPQLQQEGVRRLGLLCLVFGVVDLLYLPFGVVLSLGAAEYVLTFAFSAISFTLYYLIRTERFASAALLNAGCAWAIAGAFAVGIVLNKLAVNAEPSFAWSPVAVWAFMFPIIVPGTWLRVILTSAVIASMDPLTMLVLVASQRIDPSLFSLPRFLPNVAAVVMAALASRIAYRLGARVTAAWDLGSYALDERLGMGGMGEVWRARHRLLARPAAVKLIRSDALGTGASRDTLLQRFEREAQATASLQSPHTIQLYDFGVTDDGTFYYVMELLDGFDAAILVERFGPVEPRRAIYFLQQICESLGEAHFKGLIHRDLKPGNVYICRYSREVDFLKVLDFGLVKPYTGGSATSLTADHTITGTPGFMAPEQIIGNRPVDARSDIYGVGCLAYWLLTGGLVFQTDTVMETLMRHVQDQPVPPSRISELRIPGELDEVVLACLEKDPDRRPRDVDDLNDRLKRCAATAKWTQESSRQWWSANVPG